MTLTEFLLARIAEDEAWTAEHPHFGDGSAPDYVPPWWTRVLAECEAKRRIMALHDFDFVAPAGAESSWDEFTSCRTCRGDSGEYPCPTLRALASVYADHPDYRQEWKL